METSVRPTEPMRDLAPRNLAATTGAALRSLLREPATLLQRRTLLALAISVPLWMYATAWDVVVMLFGDEAEGKSTSLNDVLHRALTRVLLLPLLAGAYLLAVRIAWRPGRRLWFVASQAAIALVFSSLTRPALVTAYYLTNREFAASHGFREALALVGPWQIWLATTVQYSIVYLLGLVLLFGLNAFLRYKSEQLKAVQLRSKWLEARLGTLRGQLNPHFFFNSLNAIVALIHTDPDRAERLVTELGALLRRSLTESHHEFTTVKEEIAFVERYLAVMKARYEDRLNVRLHLEAGVLDCRIPTFLLVPLVENAIKHGVARVPGADTVEIVGRRDGAYLQFMVRNRAAAGGAGPADSADGGLGLRNLRRRLTAIYGGRYRFESARNRQDRWLACVAIPFDSAATLAAESEPA